MADAQSGLDLFAAAWIERMHSYGGSAIASRDGTKLVATIWPEKKSPTQWEDGARVGAQRELIDLAHLIPGGCEAIAAHVARYPTGVGEGTLSL